MSRDIRCPFCRHWLDLEALAADAAQAELMQSFFRLEKDLQLAMAPYISLWRAESRDITPERQLRILREALALEPDQATLAAALSRCTEAVRRKWDATGQRRPLQDHGYLRPVLDSVRHERTTGTLVREPQQPAVRPPATRAPTSTEQGLAALQARRARHTTD
jgi:hypothetical protein